MRSHLLGLLIISLLILIPFSSAFTATIANPRMVFYENISKGEVLEIQNSVIAVNDNPEKVFVNITPLDEFEDRFFIEKNYFEIESDERKEINYTVFIDKSGVYEGNILVTFKEKNSPNKLSLVQEIIIFAIDKESGKVFEEREDILTGNAVNIRGDFEYAKGIFILILFILLAITGVYYFRRKNK